MNLILKNYLDCGLFFYSPKECLKKMCIAPNDKAGVYLFKNGNRLDEILYIGCSGNIQNDGSIHIRSTGGGGLYGRIVHGHQFGKVKRFNSLPIQMKQDNITLLKVEWFVTHTDDYLHSPIYLESLLLQNYLLEYNKLPRWNKKF
jgi:hypothetical protein